MRADAFMGTSGTRALLLGFVRREFANRYAGTFMGWLWVLAQPALLLAIYAFVFRHVFKVRLPDPAYAYVTVVACALWPWMAFQEAVQRATVSITANAELIRKIRFPNHLLVLAAVLASFAVHLAGFLAIFAVLALCGEPIHYGGLPVALAAWGVAFALALAMALVTAALQVAIKDVEPALGPLFMLFFYATPILYPLALVPEAVRPWLALNPLVHVVEPIRAALLGGESLVALGALWPAALVALCLFFFARWLFARLEDYFQDFL
ncbi:MAG: ABC transporter permease [Azoarcus sp.]|jgi:ABC-type polysaccharide/polyol phosphate export permease|nr:ABC transporter permease [Azoarcus sp.]